jgi:hypothetical protein
VRPGSGFLTSQRTGSGRRLFGKLFFHGDETNLLYTTAMTAP